MTILIVLTVSSLLLLGLTIYLDRKDNELCVLSGILSICGFVVSAAMSALNPISPNIVKVFSPSQLIIETTPYRVVVTTRFPPHNEFLWKDAYTVARAKDITHLRVTTPVNAWGVTLDSQTKVELLFSNSTAPEATAR